MAVQRITASRVVFNVFNYTFIFCFTLFCLFPFALSFMVSITDERAISQYGYNLIPKKFSLDAYRFIFGPDSKIIRAYLVSTFVTVVGTVLAVFVTGMLAYVISNRKLKYSGVISMYVFITMMFGGGLIPWYIICRTIGLNNTVWALIVPALVNAFNVYILRNFFYTVPVSIPESARIDGASEMTIFLKLMLPLSLPGVAAIALFYALGYWNDWWLAILFITNPDLYPLQYLLRRIMSDILFSLPKIISQGIKTRIVPQESVRMATMMIAIGPIIFAYPFAQKCFVKGIIIGSVKG